MPLKLKPIDPQDEKKRLDASNVRAEAEVNRLKRQSEDNQKRLHEEQIRDVAEERRVQEEIRRTHGPSRLEQFGSGTKQKVRSGGKWAVGTDAAARQRSASSGGSRSAPERGSGLTSGNEGSGWIFFWIAIVLYLSDFLTRFNGVNYKTLFNTFLTFNFQTWKGLLLNGTVLICLIIYIAIKRPSREQIISFFALLIVSWFFISMTGWSIGPILHITFALIFLFGRLYKWFEGNEVQANLVAIFFIMFDFVFYSVVSQYASSLMFSRVSYPLWILFSLFFVRPSKIKTVMIVLVAVFYVLATVDVVAQVNQLKSSSLAQKDISAGKKILEKIWNNLKSIPQKIKQSEEMFMAEAVGYNTGEIDRNAKEKLGVYLDEIQLDENTFYEKQPITIWTSLVAKTIKEPITIKIGCTEGEEGKDMPDEKVEIQPKEPFTVESSEKVGVECTFKESSLSVGNHKLGLKADFNFLTMAYIKTYFMDKEAKRALVAKGIDPLDRYGIAEKNPQPKYTSGPINVGLDLSSDLPLPTDQDLRLAISLTKVWEGKLKSLKEVFIITPKQMSMFNQRESNYYCTSSKRTYIFEKASCKDISEENSGCDDSKLHNVFKSKIPPDGITDIKDFETILCRFKIDDVSELMGNVPIATKYFEVVVKYDYSINKEVNVEIIKGDGIKAALVAGCYEKCVDDDGCICPNECKGSTIEKGKGCGGLKGDGVRTTIDCSQICVDSDGCVCGSGCVTGGNIDINDACGVAAVNQDTPQQTVSCDESTWKIKCAECNDEQPGVYCFNGNWVCTTLANKGDPSYHNISPDCNI
jgi:hypothetical protein